MAEEAILERETPSVEETDSDDDSRNIYEELAGEILTDETSTVEDEQSVEVPESAPVPEETTAAESLKEETPVVTGTTVEEEPVTPIVEEVQSPPVEEQPQPVEQPPREEPVEAVKPPTPEESAAKRQQLVGNLAKEVYKLSDEDVELAISEPDKVLPQLAAKVHVEVLDAAVQGIMAHLPELVRGVISQTSAEREREGAFFDRWPSLKEHKTKVAQVANIFRQSNPGATLDQAIEEVGTLVSVMMKVPMEGVEAPKSADVAAPPPPPAMPGASTITPRRSTQKNAFETLADEFLIEDIGD